MPHQSYRDVLVTNNPALFGPGGYSDELGVGQLGIFLADPKQNPFSVIPDFKTHKIIQIVQGTPELAGNLLGAVANASDRSKPIKGKKILNWEGRAAERGKNQIVALGYDGVDVTKTMSARCEESKTVFVKLSGGPVDEIFHTEGKGYVRQYNMFSGCCDDCGDDCAQVSAEAIADDLVKQVMNDPIMALGTRTGNKLYTARKVLSSAAPTPDDTCQEYLLATCDNGDDTSLGLVQSRYAGTPIVRKSRTAATSVYQMILDSALPAPAAFSNAGLTFISDCATCPDGYTSVDNNFAYVITRMDTGDAPALQAVTTEFGIVSPENISRVNYQFGQSTYVAISATALSDLPAVNEVQSIIATGGASGTFTLTFAGQTTGNIAYNATASAVQSALEALSNINPGDVVVAGGPLPGTAVTVTFTGQYAGVNVAQMTVVDSITGGDAVVSTVTPGFAGTSGEVVLLNDNLRAGCVLTTPSTIAWTEGDEYERFDKDFKITLKDNVCGTSRLAELQAAYPDLVISETIVGECTRLFTTTVSSNCVPPGCPADVPQWVAPDAFEGIEWVAVPVTPGADVSVGVIFESSFIDRVTGECAYDYWNYDAEPLFIEISQHSQDYNDNPTICANEWPVTEIQELKLPIGVGSRVREEEAFFKGYRREFRDPNPIVREAQNSVLQTDPHQFYDQYTLSFEFDFHQSWFSEKLTDSYRLEVYFPEGKGKEFEAAINAYITSVGIDLPPVVL